MRPHISLPPYQTFQIGTNLNKKQHFPVPLSADALEVWSIPNLLHTKRDKTTKRTRDRRKAKPVCHAQTHFCTGVEESL